MNPASLDTYRRNAAQTGRDVAAVIRGQVAYAGYRGWADAVVTLEGYLREIGAPETGPVATSGWNA